MSRSSMNLHFTATGVLITCLGAVALFFLTGFHQAPAKPRKTMPIIRAAAASASGAALAYYQDHQSRLSRATALLEEDKAVAWSFTDGIPEGWRVTHSSRIRRTEHSGTVVETRAKNFEEQLRSPGVLMPRGDYQIVVEALVVRGGLVLGAAQGSTCVGNSFFSADQWRRERGRALMVRPLKLRSRREIRVVLSNWSYPDAVSLWNIKRVFIRSLSLEEKMAARYATLASPLVRMTRFLVTNVRFSWNVGASLSEWSLPHGARARSTQAGRLIRTARSTYSYELTTKVALGRGPYLLRLHGNVLTGGMSLGAVDVRTNRWLGQRFYWHGQSSSPGAIAVPFSVKRSGTVELVIANWSVIAATTSKWVLRRIELIQLF